MKISKEEELKKIKDRFDIIYNYFTDKGGHSPFFEQTKDIFDSIYEQKNLKGARAIDKELDKWLRDMTNDDSINIKKLLQEHLNEDVAKIDQDRLKAIDRIKKKNKISNNTEYTLIHEMVEEIYADKTRIEEIRKLNELLIQYHSKNQ